MGAAGMRDGGGGGEGREGRMGEAVSHNQTQKWRKMKISWHHDVYAIKTGHKTILFSLPFKILFSGQT